MPDCWQNLEKAKPANAFLQKLLADFQNTAQKANATKNCEVCIIKMCFYIKKYGTIIKNIRTIKMRGMGNETDI